MSTNKLRILVSESRGFSAEAAGLLRQSGELVLADLDRPGLLSAVCDADVLWVRLRHRIDAEVMAAAERLKIIVTATTGLDHIDLDDASRRGIPILCLRGHSEFLRDVRATAEHTVALILALLRRVPSALGHVCAGGWNRDLFQGRELYGKVVGVVGYGRLGRIVARYLRAFDTRILAADPHVDAGSVDAGVTLVPMTELLRQADLVTLHVNLCEDTWKLFSSELFALMKKGAWFINTSRGELLDETALLEALNSGRLAGAALDVLCEEHGYGRKGHPLLAYAREHENLIITPHIGGCTAESMEKTECFMAHRVAQTLKQHDYPMDQFRSQNHDI